MDTRAIHMYTAMTRIGGVVEKNPALKSRASESLVFARFMQDTRDFERLFEEEKTAKLNKPLLRQEMEDLARRIMLEVKCMYDAYRLTGGKLDLLKDVKHSKDAPAAMFTASTLGFVASMEKLKESLIDAGLHPNKFDDVRALVATFIKVHTDWASCCVALDAGPEAVKFWMERARTRGELLQGELSSAMSKELQVEWDKAAWLGRSHRPPALGSGQARALPAPANDDAARPFPSPNEDGSATSEAPTVANLSNDSIGRRTIRAVMRVLGGSDDVLPSNEPPKPASGDTGAARQGDVSERDFGGSRA